MVQVLYKENDQVIELSGLKDAIADTFINDATVTASIVDSAGDDLAGMTFPATMTYVSGSEGVYRVTLEETLVVNVGQFVKAIIIAIKGSLQGKWTIDMQANIREK